MQSSPTERFAFNEFEINVETRRLRRNGAPLSVSGKALDVLIELLRHAGHLVEKDALISAVWPEGFVEESNLTVAVSSLRKALGEAPGENRYIATVPARGYRFVGTLREPSSPREPVAVHPSALRRYGLVPAIALGVAIAVVVVAVLVQKNRGATHQTQIRTVAVLPFRQLGPSSAQDAFLRVGVADTIIAHLGSIGSLRVNPTDAVLRYDRPDRDPKAVGRELGVDAVLDGTIQHADGHVRTTVQLIDAKDGSAIWGDVQDDRTGDVFAAEDSIAARIAARLGSRLGSDNAASRSNGSTRSEAAYRQFAAGRYFSDKQSEAGLERAVTDFKSAIAIDPTYASAYAELAQTYAALAVQGYRKPGDVFPFARSAASAALRLDDQSAEAHAALGIVAWAYDWDWAVAERELDRAVSLDAGSADAYDQRAFFRLLSRRFDGAVADSAHAIELDPLSLSRNETLGYVYFTAHRFGRAQSQFQHALELDGSSLFSAVMLAASYAAAGRRDPARAATRHVRGRVSANEDPLAAAIAGYAFAASGSRPEAREMLDRLLRAASQRYVDPYLLAMVESPLGDDRRMFAALDRAYAERTVSIPFLAADAWFDRWRRDPRMRRLLASIGPP